MKILIGLLSVLGGLTIWGFAISLLISWLAFCFGSIIIGILLLVFAPYVLIAPLAIGTPGTALFIYGITCFADKKETFISNQERKGKTNNAIRSDVVWERSSNNLESINKIIEDSKNDR